MQQQTQRKLVNRKGQELVTHYSDDEAFRIVEKQSEESDFAKSLTANGRKYGLTEEQFWWVHKLALPVEKTEIDCCNIRRRFHLAYDNGVKVKNLRIESVTEGGVVVLAFAGPRSKHFGTIWVTDEGEYPNNKYHGKITKDGVFVTIQQVPAFVSELLTQMNDCPERYMPW